MQKPEPEYSSTVVARGIKGVVILDVVLASSGEVTDVMVVKGLEGLTEKADEAAHRIKFKPALLGNRPVSTLVRLEYNFDVK